MRKTLPAALAVLLLSPASALVGSGHGGGGSHGGGSHGGGSHGGGSHGGGSHGGGSHDGGSHGGGSHGGGRHGGGHHGGRGRVIFGGSGGWGWWDPYYGDYYGSGYGPAYGEDQEDLAAVDIDVSPGEARAYLDGRYIGVADDFDGDPDSLYLRPGSHRLEFRLEGYESLSINIDAEPGATIEVRKKLHRMPGAKQHGPYEAPQSDNGVHRYRGQPHGAAEPDDGNGPPLRNGRDEDARAEQDQAPPPAAEGQKENAWRQRTPATSPARQRARLLLSAQPGDAAVYLDDHFLGTVEELGLIDGGLPLTLGRHTITLSRPGFKSRTVEIEVASGEAKKVDVSLDK